MLYKIKKEENSKNGFSSSKELNFCCTVTTSIGLVRYISVLIFNTSHHKNRTKTIECKIKHKNELDGQKRNFSSAKK
jgi:hypothetical protein